MSGLETRDRSYERVRDAEIARIGEWYARLAVLIVFAGCLMLVVYPGRMVTTLVCSLGLFAAAFATCGNRDRPGWVVGHVGFGTITFVFGLMMSIMVNGVAGG